MCIATVYSDDGAHPGRGMRDVVWFEAEGNGFLCFSLLGEGKLKNSDFLQEHSVVFEKEERERSS